VFASITRPKDMKLEPEDIKGFQRLWENSFDLEISEKDAREKANALLEMMKLVYRPLPKPTEQQQLSILDLNQTSYEI
jgi:hypothetical protein